MEKGTAGIAAHTEARAVVQESSQITKTDLKRNSPVLDKGNKNGGYIS